ncbi:LuxR family transcriptional regulator, partial [Streptomyces massasporeus]
GPVAVLLDELAPLDGAQRAVVEALAVLDGCATAELLAATVTPPPVGRPSAGPPSAGPPPAGPPSAGPPPAGPPPAGPPPVGPASVGPAPISPASVGLPPIASPPIPPHPADLPQPASPSRPAPPSHPSPPAHPLNPSHPSPPSHPSHASGPPDPSALDGVLRELAHRDLVRPDDDGRILVLRHPALPELVRSTLDPWRRRELHRRAADALAAAGAPVTERAPHLVRAVTAWDPDVAAELVEAAERIGAADPARAAHWLGAVLALLPDTPRHRATWRDLTLRRARALGSAGLVAESRDLLHHLIDTCGAPDTAVLRTSAVLLCAFMERHLGRYPEADALLRRELERT